MVKNTVLFYKKLNKKIDVVVVFAKYNNKWLLVKHKNRDTWEVCGGHVEKKEKIDDAAKRELYEESGAIIDKINLIGYYSFVSNNKRNYGAVFSCDVISFDNLPNYEMREMCLMDEFPLNTTYPLTYKRLLKEVCLYD